MDVEPVDLKIQDSVAAFLQSRRSPLHASSSAEYTSSSAASDPRNASSSQAITSAAAHQPLAAAGSVCKPGSGVEGIRGRTAAAAAGGGGGGRRLFGRLLRFTLRGLVQLTKLSLVAGVGVAALMAAKSGAEQVLARELDLAKQEIRALQEAQLSQEMGLAKREMQERARAQMEDVRAEMQLRVDAAEERAKEAKRELAATVSGLHLQVEKQAAAHAQAHAGVDAMLEQMRRRVTKAERQVAEARSVMLRMGKAGKRAAAALSSSESEGSLNQHQ